MAPRLKFKLLIAENHDRIQTYKHRKTEVQRKERKGSYEETDIPKKTICHEMCMNNLK